MFLHGGGNRPVQAVFFALLLWAAGSATAASDLEIIRVQVPAKSTSRCFPAGAELRIMPVESFESLVRRSSAKLERRLRAEPPRLVARSPPRAMGRRCSGWRDRSRDREVRDRIGGLSAGRMVAGGAFHEHESGRGLPGGRASWAAFRRAGAGGSIDWLDRSSFCRRLALRCSRYGNAEHRDRPSPAAGGASGLGAQAAETGGWAKYSSNASGRTDDDPCARDAQGLDHIGARRQAAGTTPGRGG